MIFLPTSYSVVRLTRLEAYASSRGHAQIDQLILPTHTSSMSVACHNGRVYHNGFYHGPLPVRNTFDYLHINKLSLLSSTKMATLEPPVGSGADATIDVGDIWRTAISRYEKTSMVKLESLAGASSVDEVLNDVHERGTKFKSYRHDGSKLDRFRTLVSKSLNPIDQVCNLVGLAASTVRRQPLPAF